MPEGSRPSRVSEEFREILAEDIPKLKEPRVGFGTVTGVTVTPDHPGVPAVTRRSKVHAAISVRIAASGRAVVARNHGGSTASLRLRAAHVSSAAQE